MLRVRALSSCRILHIRIAFGTPRGFPHLPVHHHLSASGRGKRLRTLAHFGRGAVGAMYSHPTKSGAADAVLGFVDSPDVLEALALALSPGVAGRYCDRFAMEYPKLSRPPPVRTADNTSRGHIAGEQQPHRGH